MIGYRIDIRTFEQTLIHILPKMESFENLKDPQNYLSPATQKLIAQAWKIHMFRRMIGCYAAKNAGLIFKRHQSGINEILSEDVTSNGTSWRVKCPDVHEGSVLVNFVEASDFLCDCIDYPYDYVCKDCKICIHMYTCSCQEVDEFPSLICKHIHAVCQFGEGVVQKPDIKKHTLTAHRTPGHRWPNPMFYRLDIVNYKKRGSPKGLIAVSSENVKVDDDLANGKYVLPANWETDFYKTTIAQEQIRNDLKETLTKRKLEDDDKCVLYFKRPRHDDPESQIE